jgi:hypothetical protein
MTFYVSGIMVATVVADPSTLFRFGLSFWLATTALLVQSKSRETLQ